MIVITGASDGLAKEIAGLYIKAGKRVIGLSRGKCDPGIERIETDLLSESSINDATKKINSDKEKIEALINCAGVFSIEKIASLTPKEVDRVLWTNVRAPMLLTSQLIKKIIKDGGDILNVASTVGLKGYPDQAAYGASKWGMRGFSANLQTELKDTKCRVISFCPGGFKSKLFLKATGKDNTEDGSVWMKSEDVAAFVKQILDLPKNMEVTEVVLNRKVAK